MKTRALLVIDLQNDYFPGGKWELSGIEAAAGNAAKLIEAARAAGDPIFHVRHEFPVAEAPFFVVGSEGAKHHESVRPLAGETVLLKHQVNAFRDTDLRSRLDSKGIEEVVICGAMSHMCIDAVTRAAADYGYWVTLVHDACATRDVEFDGVTVPAAQVHAAFMSALSFAYADTVSTEAYLSALKEQVA